MTLIAYFLITFLLFWASTPAAAISPVLLGLAGSFAPAAAAAALTLSKSGWTGLLSWLLPVCFGLAALGVLTLSVFKWRDRPAA